MPRRTRMYIPGFTYHIVQRGNNREACFLDEQGYKLYLDYLRQAMARYGTKLHAYCLMTNHVHLQVTPEHEDSISRTMKVVCSRYAQFVNKQYRRSGTLWEGRHKASAIDCARYLLKCYRYIELNPVTAHMVDRPEEYSWSSYHYNAWGDNSDILTPHPEYLALDARGAERRFAYRELFKVALADDDLHLIRRAIHYSMPCGSDRFLSQIEQKTGRPIGYMQRGRPRKIV